MTATFSKPVRNQAGIQMAILTQRFEGIVRGMANTLLRASRSGIMNTAHDFSCCVLTTEPALLAMAQSLPIHVMSGPDVSARFMSQYHTQMRPGDAFLHNSPYEGNSHAADYAVLVPVFDDDEVHRYTVYAKGHMADCGNGLPTTYAAAARDVYEEGALIFPMVQIQRDFADCEDIIRMCEARIRAPEQWRGDYDALIGAARIGERMMKALAGDVGWEVLDQYAGDWLAYSERAMTDAIRRLPSGFAVTKATHDPFPGIPDGLEVSVSVDVDAEDGRITVDLRANPDCIPCGLNLTEATATTAAMIGVFNALPTEVPHNGGSCRRITVKLRDGCAVGKPRHPYSCSVATTGLANRLGGAVQRALADMGPGIGMADTGLIMNPAYAVISGEHPVNHEPFVNQLMLAHSGGAASFENDGWLTASDHGAGGVVRLDSVEIDELQYPLVVWRREVEVDSEAPGFRRGAPGTIVEYSPLECEINLMYASDGSINPPKGAAGGHDGCLAHQSVIRSNGDVEDLPAYGVVTLREHDRIVCRTTGGGGYGNPYEREPERVSADVGEGWISRERAASAYGVVLNEAGDVDVAATAAGRAVLR